LTNSNTEYHTLSLPVERILKIVIKGLLREITDTEVSEELTNLDYTVTNVRQFGKQDQKLPIHIVVFKNTPENKVIFNLRLLFYMAIEIERYESNTPAQCYNCQQFGHSSLYCCASPRCVKCAGNYKAKDCTKPPEEKPKCTNCEADYIANYKKCPAITQETEKRHPLKPKIQETSSEGKQ